MSDTNLQRASWFTALIVLLAAIYMVSYTGRVEIADELQYYDAVGSLARFGEPTVGVSAWQFMPANFSPQGSTPLRETIAEPGFIYAAALLYALADRIDGLGLAHTTWLFNVIMTPLVCAAFYAVARALMFTPRAALAGTLALGLLTVMWAYSTTFFREPMMMLFALLAALALIHWQRARRRVWLLIIAAGFFALAFITKEASVLLLPTYFALTLPDSLWARRGTRRISLALMVAALIVPVLLVYTPILDYVPPLRLVGNYQLEPEYTRTALHTYAFSLGGSFWGTSPVLLLGFIGAAMLHRRGQHRLMWAALASMLMYSVGYGLLRGEQWFGGTIWPQRFLMPVLPFALILVLPVFERVLDAPRKHPWLTGTALIVCAYSLWWQVIAVGFRWYAYGRATFDLSDGGLVYWSGGFNDVRYIRPVVLSGLIGQEPWNAAWARADVWWPLVVFAALALAALILLRRRSVLAFALPVVWIIAAFFAMRALYTDDPLYLARPDLLEMVDTVREQAAYDEPVLINDPEYAMFFYNYGKVGGARLITLPYHPGDRGSCDQPLQIESPNPQMLIAPYSAPLIHYVAERHPRLWLLMFSAPETPCIVRPLERFLGQRYYRASEQRASANVRLLEYSTESAPDPYGFINPTQAHLLIFTLDNGDALRLTGFTLPRGAEYRAGDALPLSLRFESMGATTREFTVAWYLADSSGRVWVEGENTWPAATFKPTSALAPRESFWDHRAAFLPPDLPVGEYQLWLRLYSIDVNTGAITLARIDGAGVAQIGDGDMAVLPFSVRITTR